MPTAQANRSVRTVTVKNPNSRGAQLRRLRVLAGLPLSELSRRSRITKGQLSMFENGIGYLSRERHAMVLAIVRMEIQKHHEMVATAILEDSVAVGQAASKASRQVEA